MMYIYKEKKIYIERERKQNHYLHMHNIHTEYISYDVRPPNKNSRSDK